MRHLFGLLAILMLAGIIAIQAPPVTHYTIGTASEAQVPYGFWSAETNGEESYRWSDGDSRLRFFGYATASRLAVTLRIIGPQGSRGETTNMVLASGPVTLLASEPPAAWRTYHLLVPAVGPAWQTPEILLGGTVTGGQQGDNRRVGVAVSRVEVAPMGERKPVAVIEYAAFLMLLLLLLWFGLSRLLSVWLALGLSLLSGGGLYLWSWLDPIGMGFWLPPLWASVLVPVGAIALYWSAQWLAPHIRQRERWLLVGLGLGLVGGILLRSQLWFPFGGMFLLLGTLLAAASLGRREEPTSAAQSIVGVNLWYLIGILASLFLAGGLRLIALDHIPFGMWRDEARHGLVALQILNAPDYRPIFVPEADIPALLFYLQSGSIALFGPTVFALRSVTALAGALTTVIIAYLAQQIWGRTTAIAAALMLAASMWHIWLSRLAFAAVLDPLLTLSALALLWRICNGKSSTRWQIFEGVLAGLALGLALYTYHPARLMPFAAALWVALRIGSDWAAWRRAQWPLVAFGLATLLVASPLLGYLLTQTSDFNQRVSQVGLFSRADKEWSLTMDLDYNVLRYSLMWHVAGDEAARHNIPGLPMLDPLTGLLFLIGLLVLLLRQNWRVSLPLLALLGVGLAPGLLSPDAPHAVRTVDAIAPTILIAAYAAAQITQSLALSMPRLKWGLLASGVLFIAIVNGWSYMGRVPYDQRMWDAFSYTAETSMGQIIQQGVCTGPIFMPEDYATSEVLAYLAPEATVIPFELHQLPAAFPHGACLFIPSEIPANQRAALEAMLEGVQPQVLQRYPGREAPVFWIYRV
ncbi:glycosyltransferase family 39 protein [Candidatus Chloroploca sp. Khr17]|uniref:ArnT family glycosyltransferase n=1 Tax=Candidatus Chloroploca sp. Khr17 TaxID=2496869 RepID=UPI00101D7E11|nr:glycosyltransferase family 39 protein [Candidatus Chloroploca sp. Khr17]